eukprot:TRINITY_DN3358_c0_g1_i10.p1 TRINITY_DN3358_c0_g1~~TRINITY_DN3358_c0_g1_i10.p1  ORF type:complete len:196 (+),score=87.92 TRINITY_DN3358_c0_g1_i10:245-832(+)
MNNFFASEQFLSLENKKKLNELNKVLHSSFNELMSFNYGSLSKITEEVYISGIDPALNVQLLSENKITTIVNVSNYSNVCGELYSNEFDFISFPVNDIENCNILNHFEETWNFLQSSKTKKSSNFKVLFHCMAGVSRSTTLATAYLMKLNNWNCKKTLTFIRSKRPQIYPNSGFLLQLILFENQLEQQLGITLEQ